MIKRWSIYTKEMYPIPARLVVGVVLFFEVYFLTIITNNARVSSIGMAEVTGALTIFLFLFFLRIADDLKDAETDARLFPHRVIPSGRVLKKDLYVLGTLVVATMVILNLLFMNNLYFFIFFLGYGFLMSVWFFRKNQIQNSLPTALVTHNPIQIIMNIYIISFACIKYNIPFLTLNNLVIAVTLYFPGLVWELSRKVWAPKDETEYVTYSKLFGYQRMTYVILGIMLFDVFTTSFLLYQIYPIAVVTVVLSYAYLVYKGLQFIKDPTQFKLVKIVERYEYVTEVTVLLFIALHIFQNYLG